MILKEYEIELRYTGKGEKPDYTKTEYGFETNPPIVIRAKNKVHALKQLKLPKTVKIKRIKRID